MLTENEAKLYQLLKAQEVCDSVDEERRKVVVNLRQEMILRLEKKKNQTQQGLGNNCEEEYNTMSTAYMYKLEMNAAKIAAISASDAADVTYAAAAVVYDDCIAP